jgi:putative Holliday junction resolvase
MPSPPAAERLIGLDYGRARIGVAVSDGPVAVPYGFIPRQDDAQAAAAVAAVAASHRAAGIILGMPRNTDGSYGENARWVQRFRATLAKATALPITLVDERHSSAEAEAELRRAGRWPCQPGQLDAQAATIILRRHLG